MFFAGNRPNYARWMVKYHLNLLNIDKTHPGLRYILEHGAMSVKRTLKPFSRAAVDLALEQTVNADAASRHTGIAAFTQSEGARRRWMITRSARSAVVGELLAQAGLKSLDDVSKETKKYRMTRDQKDLAQLLEGITSTMNPFSMNPDPNLYCITTGKKVSDDISNDLISVIQKGETWCDEFRQACKMIQIGLKNLSHGEKLRILHPML